MADTSSITTTEPLLPTLLVIQPTVHTTNSVKLKFGVAQNQVIMECTVLILVLRIVRKVVVTLWMERV